uniref:Uncharacterized protein n=1 Tax=Seriola dumerili TaxID=41447 RepID=A0A3B4TGC3_SERDU
GTQPSQHNTWKSWYKGLLNSLSSYSKLNKGLSSLH